jgi:hypothetical protein
MIARLLDVSGQKNTTSWLQFNLTQNSLLDPTKFLTFVRFPVAASKPSSCVFNKFSI